MLLSTRLLRNRVAAPRFFSRRHLSSQSSFNDTQLSTGAPDDVHPNHTQHDSVVLIDFYRLMSFAHYKCPPSYNHDGQLILPQQILTKVLSDLICDPWTARKYIALVSDAKEPWLSRNGIINQYRQDAEARQVDLQKQLADLESVEDVDTEAVEAVTQQLLVCKDQLDQIGSFSLHSQADYNRPSRAEFSNAYNDLKAIAKGFGVQVFETQVGAGHVIAGITKNLLACEDPVVDITIMSNNKLFNQLLCPQVVIQRPPVTTQEVITSEATFLNENVGLHPTRYLDMISLMGLPSQDVLGISGVGRKTALQLINDYGALDSLFQKLDSGELAPTSKVMERIHNKQLTVELSQKLLRFDPALSDHPDVGLSDIKVRPDIDWQTLHRVLNPLGITI